MFSVGAPSRVAAAPARSGSSILIWFARIGVYLGLFAGVGGVFFVAWIGQGPAGGPVILTALYIGLASAIASLGLQGIDLLGLSLGGIFTIAPWKVALGTSLGPSLLLAIAAMLVARLAWRSPSLTIAWGLTALSMVGAGSALAASGHASTASPQWLTRPSVLIHGVGVAYWVGALAPLAVMAHRRANTLPSVLKRFSAGAVPVVGLLALTGLVLACVQLASVSALFQTRYGVLLSIKLVLVALLLVLAAFNRYRLTSALAVDPMRSRPLFAVRIHRVPAGSPDSCGRCRVALHPTSAGARRGCRRSALDPHPHRCCDGSGADRSGQGRKLWSACGQGSHAGAESAGTRGGSPGAEGHARF
jgi:copper transport protein